MVSMLGFRPAEVIAMATTEAAAALGLGAVTGRLAPGYEADLIVVDGDPLADIAALGGCGGSSPGTDYVPDSGRFDVSAPGTPFASPDHAVDLRLSTRRPACASGRPVRPAAVTRARLGLRSVHAVQEHERSRRPRPRSGRGVRRVLFPEDRADYRDDNDDRPDALNVVG